MQIDAFVESPVARIGDRIIRYREIRCDAGEIEAATGGKPSEEFCRDAEERELHRIIGNELSAVVCRKYGIELTAEEAAEAVPVRFRDDRLVRQITEMNRTLARAALRIHHGEDKQRVYNELSDDALSAKGITIRLGKGNSDSILRLFPDAAAAERALASYTDERSRAKLREPFENEAIGRKITALIERRAPERN